MWIHGGYSSHYPYPSSTSPGSTSGITSKRRKGFIPYASHSFYFNDLRFYNMSSGFWKEMQMGVLCLCISKKWLWCSCFKFLITIYLISRGGSASWISSRPVGHVDQFWFYDSSSVDWCPQIFRVSVKRGCGFGSFVSFSNINHLFLSFQNQSWRVEYAWWTNWADWK